MATIKITVEVDEAIIKNFEALSQDNRTKLRITNMSYVINQALKTSIERRQGKPIELTEDV